VLALLRRIREALVAAVRGRVRGLVQAVHLLELELVRERERERDRDRERERDRERDRELDWELALVLGVRRRARRALG
jgi:hypothetical protein